MATRPAKRQRRSTIIVSDDDDSTGTTESLQPSRPQIAGTRVTTGRKAGTFAKSSQNKNSASTTAVSSAKPSPTPSPQKTRKSSKQSLESSNNKSLHSFFNKASEEQRWHRRAGTPQQESQEGSIVDDIVDDDLEDEYLAYTSQSQSFRQKSLSPPISLNGSRVDGLKNSIPHSSSQKFAKPKGSSRLSTKAEDSETTQDLYVEQKPWADRYGPTSIDELAVHKRKVADVQKWIEDVTLGRSPQRILVLKGPAGSGKSTTVLLLAQALGIEVVSWQNPAVSEIGQTSSVQQFADFLERGGQFEALSFANKNIATLKGTQSEGQMLMVEEFPTSMTRSSHVLDSFRSILLQHIFRSSSSLPLGFQKQSSSACQPLVLVVSETLTTSSTALSDSFTAHRLLGPELSNHSLINVIEFNPVAPTFISKAIDLVIKKEARDSKRRRLPGPAVLSQLADVGDVRSAINSLEFLCARGDNTADWSGTVATRSKKASKTTAPLTESEKSALQLINQRENTLDMFHATGKVVYNKREDPRVLDRRAEPPPKPPDHLMYLYTPKVSQVDVDALLNETGTDIQTFISTLHENYVLSCNGDDFVDSFDGCSSFLSDSDYLNPQSRSIVRAKVSSRGMSSNLQSGNFDMLRQDEISFQLASRGLLFALPFPVNRAIPQGTRKQDAFKMFYPASLRLWRPAEEIHDLISMYADKATYEDEVAFTRKDRTDGVTSWKSRSLAFGSGPNVDEGHDDSKSSIRSSTSKDVLVTELLPYLSMIRIGQGREAKTLKKITQLRGVNISGDELFDEEQYNKPNALPSASARLQQKVEEAHNMLQAQKLTAASRKGQTEGLETLKLTQEKLYISDDDIQDD